MAQAERISPVRLELFLLGHPEIRVNGQPLDEKPPTKGQALLFYLACTRKTLTREALSGLFWGEMDEETARANLRLTLSRLRKMVGPCLIADRREVRCDFERPIWIDVHEFETSLSTRCS
jgi:DNA-binding SARP family transcriptional activator